MKAPRIPSSVKPSAQVVSKASPKADSYTNKPGKGELLPGDMVVDQEGRHGVIEANLSTQYSVEFGNGRIGFYFKCDRELEISNG